MNPEYLDNASTTKVDDRVLTEMLPYFTEFYGNASSQHDFGQIAKKAIDKSRRQVAALLNCFEDEVIFTSGATEAINLAIKGFVEANAHQGNHIITSKTEHKAVLNTCEYLETKGIEVTYLDVDKNGLIDLAALESSIQDNTILVSIMWVNNETGVIHPIDRISEITSKNKIAFFCDATQAVGKIKVDLEKNSIDMLCFSGHKINGPKGIGVLYKKSETEISPLIHGGGQENGLRGGTYNAPLIVGLGKACEILELELDESKKNISNLNQYLISELNRITVFKEVSKKQLRVPHILNIVIPGLNSNIFIAKSDSTVISSGSACNSEIIEESHVIKSMLKKGEVENNYLRISLDKFTSKNNIDSLINSLSSHLNSMYA